MPISHSVLKTKAGLFFPLLLLSVFSTAAYGAAPVITSNGGGSTATIIVPENTTSVTTVVATDADAGTTLTYSIVGGADQGLFSINGSTGVLAFKTAPDFENPSDNNGDGNYEVIVRASDGTDTVDQAITVTVIAANNNPPVITSNGGGSTASISVAENTTSVTTVVATDADAGTTLTYSIVGGADQSLFSIDGSSGVLAFKTAPDFENPSDNNGDGNYEVTVQASDGTQTVDQAITVIVTDVVEQFRLDITVTGNGQVDASGNPTPLGGSIAACTDSSGSCQADYAPNATVSLTATPATGWHFEQWSSDCSGATASTNVSMDATKSCAATFAIDQYTLSYSADAHGSINGAASQTVVYGANGNAVTAVPDANYRFMQWSDGSTTNPRTDTNVTSNLSISASFASTIVTAAPVPALNWRTLLILAALLSLVAQAHMRRPKRAGG